MPKNLLGVSIESLMTKTGSPIFSNDDVVIPNLLQFGLPKIDAYSYCVSACWEPFIPGKSLDQNNIKAFDFFKPLDVMLNECNLNDIKDFETLMLKYEYNLKNEWAKFLNELNEYRWACDPFVSILTEGCNEKASDISSGGAIYNNYGVTSIGMGSTCDTLLNIKFLVFDSKKYTLEELNKHRKNDYKDAESVFMDISQLKHHYAHDDKDIIELVNRIIRISNMVVKNYENPLGGKVKFGLSSPFYIRDAKNAPADIAGRKKGDPWNFEYSNIKKIISCLIESNVEIVECGFLTDSINYERDKSKFTDLSQLEDIIPENRENKLFVLMVNYGDYDLNSLPVYDGKTIDGIRIAFHKNDVVGAIEDCKIIKNKRHTYYCTRKIII